jgi:tripartite-type tricarboxylate transporter receptor subunit TctC
MKPLTKKKEELKMKKMRFTFGIVAVLVIAVFGFTSAAVGADYPSKAAKFLIPFGAGGSADIMGRALAQASEKTFGQNFAAINKPGAGGGIMYSALKSSPPDGYTVGWNSTSVLTTTNIGNVPFKYDAMGHVCRIGFTAMPIAVLSNSKWKTFDQFVAYAKNNPGKIKIGNAGTGSATHLTAVLIEKEFGLKVIHVPLGAKRRVPSLLGGEVEAICVPLPEIAPQALAGKARILVMPSAKRDPSFSDVPTLKELGHSVIIELFRGISVPKGTPTGAINKLEAAFRAGAQDAKFMNIAKKKGFNISFMGQREFAGYLKEQNALIADAYRAAGLVK